MAGTRKRRGKGSSSQERSGAAKLVEFVVIVAFALLLAFVVQLFLVKTYRIPSGSMLPTLAIGQRVIVNRIGTHFGDPSVGDIVVFHPPAGADAHPAVCGAASEGYGTPRPCSEATEQRSDQTFIKRVVAVGGDRVSIRNGYVVRNGRIRRPSYIKPCGEGFGCDFPATITVPEGSFYMMGDNRGASDDSRYWGPVKEDWLIGTALATYWPLDRIGLF